MNKLKDYLDPEIKILAFTVQDNINNVLSGVVEDEDGVELPEDQW